jgi:hypothetical protein
MLNRRSFIATGSLGLALAGRCSTCAALTLSRNTVGCLLSPEDFELVRSRATEANFFESGNEKPVWHSGNDKFDFALAHALAKIANAFEVLPSFAFYDDENSPNAYASRELTLPKTAGSVFLGLSLLKRDMAYKEAPEVAVATVCAHEFGHILQYKYGLIDILNAGQTTIKRVELQADYFAGYFTGLRKRELPTYPAAVAAVAQFNVGDTAVTDRRHHGTPEERGAAVVRGFEAAFGEKKSLSEAIEQSIRYVTTQ